MRGILYGNAQLPKINIDANLTFLDMPELDSVITYDELHNAINHRKKNKAPGVNFIPNECCAFKP